MKTPFISGGSRPQAMEYADLQHFFAERDEVKAKQIFLRLFEQHRNDLEAFLRARGLQSEDLEDRIQDTFVKLWKHLDDRRRAQTGEIHSFIAFAKTVARRLYIDKDVRKNNLVLTDLHRHLYFLFGPSCPDSRFACWGQDPVLCGPRHWEQDPLHHAFRVTHGYQQFEKKDYAAFEEFWSKAVRSSKGRMGRFQDLPVLVACLFEWIDTPLTMPELVYHCSHLLRVSDCTVLLMSQVQSDSQADLTQRLGTSADRPDAEVLARETARASLNDLSPMARVVVLLGMTRYDLDHVMSARKPIRTIAGAIAQALKLPLQEAWRIAERLWSSLPLQDTEIASVLHTSRGNVQVLRTRARKRIERNLYS